MRKTAVVLLLAMTMVLAGCGSNKAEVEDVAVVQNSDTDKKSVDEKIQEENSEIELNDVIADGVLTVGTSAEFPPFEYVGADGEPDGFDIALIKAIGEKIGVKVEIENMGFDSLAASIGSKIDVAIAGMTVTKERKNMVEFSDPYYKAVQYVIVPSDSDIIKADDLKGKIIGVEHGTTGDILTEEIKDAKVYQYNKAADAVNALINENVEAVIIDKNPARVFAEKYREEIKIINGVKFGFEEEEYAIAMPKDDKELAEEINAALAEIKEDGTFDELVSRYIEGN